MLHRRGEAWSEEARCVEAWSGVAWSEEAWSEEAAADRAFPALGSSRQWLHLFGSGSGSHLPRSNGGALLSRRDRGTACVRDYTLLPSFNEPDDCCRGGMIVVADKRAFNPMVPKVELI